MLGTPVDNGVYILEHACILGESYVLQSSLYFLEGRYYILPAFARAVLEIDEATAREHFSAAFLEGDRIFYRDRAYIRFVCAGISFQVTGESFLRKFGSDIDVLIDKSSLLYLDSKEKVEDSKVCTQSFDCLKRLLEAKGETYEIS